MLFRDALGAAAVARFHHDGLAVDDLHKSVGLVEEVAALAHVAIGRPIDSDASRAS